MLRRLRAIVLTAVMWSVPWGILGGLVLAVGLRLRGFETGTTIFGLPLSLGLFGIGLKIFGILGAAAGAIFGTTMSLGERRKTLATLSTRRMLLWGAFGGGALPAIGTTLAVVNSGVSIGGFGLFAAISAALGAGSAWSMLWLARRAKDHTPPAELPAGEVFPPRQREEREEHEPVYRSTL